MVLKRDYDPSNLDLASQLEELTVHEGRGHGLSFAGDDARWLYNHPTERLEVHISANSGDIILLANARYGYQFGAPNRGQHGSLTYADSLVPVVCVSWSDDRRHDARADCEPLEESSDRDRRGIHGCATVD